MPSLLITILILQLAIHLINSIGVATINDLVRGYGRVNGRLRYVTDIFRHGIFTISYPSPALLWQSRSERSKPSFYANGATSTISALKMSLLAGRSSEDSTTRRRLNLTR